MVIRIHPVLKEMAAVFAGAGKQAYLVGGAVRDMLRGREAHDWDLATDALPEEVAALFRRLPWPRSKGPRPFVVPTGIRHGTVTVHYQGRAVEVTTFRSESGYSDGRRPDKVSFGVSIEEDLSRRDFTMNAAAYRLPSGPLTDPFGGKADIERGLIRCVGRAEERFGEDGLRPLRAVRFASQLGFRVDEDALAAIPLALPLTAMVAKERARDEIDKVIASPKPSIAFKLMETTGLLPLLLPELARCRGVEQGDGRGHHFFDVLDHSLLACDYAAAQGYSAEVRAAALFHDIGKPAKARKTGEGLWTFYRHEEESSRLAGEIFERFRYPNAFAAAVRHLIEEHMFHYEDNWSAAAVRRFVIRAGEEYLGDLWRLRRCDAFAAAGVEPPADFLLPLQRRVDKVLASRDALSLKDLAVSGRDILALGAAPGKRVGIILQELLSAVVEDPELNTREKLMSIAASMMGEWGMGERGAGNGERGTGNN